MKVSIITPEKTIFEGEATLLQLPGIDGSFEVLKNHAPLISTLGKGNIRIVNNEGNDEFFEINGGLIEVLNNDIKILAQ